GGHEYWRPSLLPLPIRLVHWFLDRFAWDGGPVTIDRTLSEGDEVAGFRVIELPGHAPGLIGLWRERDRLALVTDALYLTDMWGRPQAPALPVDAYNFDRAQAAASLAKLAALDPLIVAPGHLGPLTGDDVGDVLRRVAEAG
ncbi:MAG: MBL fold metallo-hydrolase, partial [Solirubrobacteraceae bacterium]